MAGSRRQRKADRKRARRAAEAASRPDVTEDEVRRRIRQWKQGPAEIRPAFCAYAVMFVDDGPKERP